MTSYLAEGVATGEIPVATPKSNLHCAGIQTVVIAVARFDCGLHFFEGISVSAGISGMRIANCDGLKIGRCVEVITLHSNKVPTARCVVGHFFHVECKRKIISEARPNTSFQGSGGNCDTLETPCIRSFREQAV